MKIARSMLEIAINAEFLRQFPEYVDNYIDYWFVERYKLLQYVRNVGLDSPALYPKQLQDEIDREFQNVRQRFEIVSSGKEPRLRPSWCSMDLDARAARTGFHSEYKLIYPMGNRLLHGTIGGMSMHADKSVDSARIATPPSLRNCKLALVGGHLCALRVMRTVSELMNRKPSPPFEVLDKDWEFAWPEQTETAEESE